MHTFLSLDVSIIPKETKEKVDGFWRGKFSNDGKIGDNGSYEVEPSRLLIDGYNEKGELVHPQSTLDYWLQWSENPEQIQWELLNTAVHYDQKEIKSLKNNPESIWYEPPAEYL